MSEASRSPQRELSPLERFRAWHPGQSLPHLEPEELAQFPVSDAKEYFVALGYEEADAERLAIGRAGLVVLFPGTVARYYLREDVPVGVLKFLSMKAGDELPEFGNEELSYLAPDEIDEYLLLRGLRKAVRRDNREDG